MVWCRDHANTPVRVHRWPIWSFRGGDNPLLRSFVWEFDSRGALQPLLIQFGKVVR